jgi:O-antigen/teichoic acid export membrane protein
MLQKIKSLGKLTVVYGIGSILNKLLGFILIPLYNKQIPIADFGVLVVFETTILFLTAILSFGLNAAHQRFFYLEHQNNSYGKYLFNNFFGGFLLVLFSIAPILFFSKSFSSLLFPGEHQFTNLKISMWIVVVEILYIIPLQYLQYKEKPIQYLFYNALKLALSFGLTIFFVKNLKMGVEGILYARLIGGGVTVLISLFTIILPQCESKIDLQTIKKSIKFGLPMVVSNIGYTLFMISDRYLLNWLSTSEETGKYGFGLKIANFINLIFVQTIGMSYFPSIMSNESEKDNVRYYRKMLTYYCFVIGFLVLGFLLFYKDILWIVVTDKKYWEGLKVVPMLSLSFMIMGMNYFVGIGLFLKNQTKYYLFPSFSALLINIVLNFLLIPKYGMIGAGISVIAAQIIYTGLLAYFSGKHFKINFEWNKVLSIYILAILSFVLFESLNINNVWISLLFRIVILFSFPFILYKLNFFEKIEILRLKEGLIKMSIGLKQRFSSTKK